MKTTNFENSKKLAEIGFNTYTQFYHSADAKCNSKGEDADDYELIYSGLSYSRIAKNYNIPSYDLETILEQISFVIHDVEKSKIFWFQMTQQGFEYRSFEGETLIDFYIVRQKDESLVDTAARLLIALAEQKIINFK